MDFDFNDVIDMTPAEAALRLADRGIRVVRAWNVDGQFVACTADFRTDRLNVATTDGKIASIGGVG